MKYTIVVSSVIMYPHMEGGGHRGTWGDNINVVAVAVLDMQIG